MLHRGTQSDVGHQNENRTSSSATPVLNPRAPPDGAKYRKHGELKRLQKEIRMLEEELQVVEGYPCASKICRELLQFTEACADPLLPITKGPIGPAWNRWFQHSFRTGEDCCCFKY